MKQQLVALGNSILSGIGFTTGALIVVFIAKKYLELGLCG